MIEVISLTKRFGQILAVDRISFRVGRGEVLGFLGPNGAGKSTTMRMITGFLPPSEGTLTIGGLDVLENPIGTRRQVGYLPENAPVYPDMRVGGFLGFIAEVRGFSGQEKARRVEAAMEKCYLGQVRMQSVSTLSKGYKQRVCFAQSILHDPEYLIMDEPTDGLDPNQKYEVREMIREMGREKTIILSTHILDEVDAVCTRAIIIAGGKIVADETPAALRARSPRHGSVKLVLEGEAQAATGPLCALGWVRNVETLPSEDGRTVLRISPREGTGAVAEMVLALCRERGYPVVSISTEAGRLDEVFRMITTSAAAGGEL